MAIQEFWTHCLVMSVVLYCSLCLGLPEEVYYRCGRKNLCVAFPVGCLSSKTCEGIVLGQFLYDSMMEFSFYETETSDWSYLALGISEDGEMGEDGVIACIKMRDYEDIVARLSYNLPRDNIDIQDDELQSQLQLMEFQAKENYFFCRVKTPVIINIYFTNNTDKNYTYDFISSKYHPLLASGHTDKYQLLYHSLTAAFEEVNFTDEKLPQWNSLPYLKSFHGIAMILSFVLFLPTASFIGHCKEVFKSFEPRCDLEMWKVLHIIISCIALALCYMGVIAIQFRIGWGIIPQPKSGKIIVDHAIIGLTVTALLTSLAVSSFLPVTPTYRFYKIVIHQIFGYVLFILALSNLYIVPGMICGKGIVIVWAVVHFLCLSTLIIVRVYFMKKMYDTGQQEPRDSADDMSSLYDFKVQDSSSEKSIQSLATKSKTPTWTTIMLVIFISACLIFTFSMVSLVNAHKWCLIEEARNDQKKVTLMNSM